VEVRTLNGSGTFPIPAETQSGRTFRLRGQGMTKLKKSGERGDLLARIKVAIPTNLSARERELFEELRSLGSR
jgi:DnaJ-class molecular chaperone